jgi:hypothetical protein
VELGGGLGDCVAVFQRHERLLDETTPVCVSILPPDADLAASEIPPANPASIMEKAHDKQRYRA